MSNSSRNIQKRLHFPTRTHKRHCNPLLFLLVRRVENRKNWVVVGNTFSKKSPGENERGEFGKVLRAMGFFHFHFFTVSFYGI